MAKVFIPRSVPEHDYSSAKEYGDLVYIYNGEHYNPFQVEQQLDKVVTVLETSSPDDWIVVEHPMALLAILCNWFGQKHHRLNLLVYHAAEDRYVPVTS